MAKSIDYLRPPLRQDPDNSCVFYSLYVGDAPNGTDVFQRNIDLTRQVWYWRYDQVIQDDIRRSLQCTPALDHTLWATTCALLFSDSMSKFKVYTPCIYTPDYVAGTSNDMFNSTHIVRDYCNTLTCYIRCRRPYCSPNELMEHVKAAPSEDLPPLPKYHPDDPPNHTKELENLLAMMDWMDGHRNMQIGKAQQRSILFARHSTDLVIPPQWKKWLDDFASVETVMEEPSTNEVVKFYCWPKGCEVLVTGIEERMAEVLVRDHSECPLVDTPRLMTYIYPDYKPKEGAVAAIMSTSTRRNLVGGEEKKKVPTAAAAAAAVGAIGAIKTKATSKSDKKKKK